MLDQRLRLAADVVLRDFDSETVLLHLTTGQYHGLNVTGGRMLEVAQEAETLSAALAQLAAEYDEPADRIEADLTGLIEGLLQRKLVELYPASA